MIEKIEALVKQGAPVPLDLVLALIDRLRKAEGALRGANVSDCGCGFPCECYSWSAMAAQARAYFEEFK